MVPIRLTLLSCAVAGIVFTSAQKIKTDEGNIEIQTPKGNDVYLTRPNDYRSGVGLWETVNKVNAIDESLKTLSNSITADVQKSIKDLRSEFDTENTNTKQSFDDVDTAMKSLKTETQSSINDLKNDVVGKLSDDISAQSTATAASIKKTSDDISALFAKTRKELQADTDLVNVSISKRLEQLNCELQGLDYDVKTKNCVPSTTSAFGKPDFESGWFSMQMKKGKASYKQIQHGLQADPAYVRVIVVLKKPGHTMDGFSTDGMGGPVCDGVYKGQGSCDEYGGFIFGYSSENIRIWLPTDQYAQIIYTGDGWGDEALAVVSSSFPNSFVKVVAWKSYMGAKPDFDKTVDMQAGGSRSATFKKVAHGFDSLPGHVLVTAEATSGVNKGYKFYSRGAGVVDDDYNKRYGGLVSAYNEQEVRLWVPSTNDGNPNGFIILTSGGYGGEAMPSRDKAAKVRVRAWKKTSVAEPDYVGKWIKMCDHPSKKGSRDNRYQSRTKDFGYSSSLLIEDLEGIWTAMPNKSPLPKPDNKGRPSRIVVNTMSLDAPNFGFIFECVPGGGDDEYDDGTGCYYIHKENQVAVFAPTYNNAGRGRRFVGVNDGWGMGQYNQASRCAEVQVLAWK